MREIQGDAWAIDCDVLCITTNCTIKGGVNVMGGGIAKEAARQYPMLSSDYADLISRFGHHVYLLSAKPAFYGGCNPRQRPLLMFPTKNEVWENSSLARVALSIQETKALADIYGWKDIVLPRPGCGLGGLDWHNQVKPFFSSFVRAGDLYLDDRFIIVSFPGEA